MAEPPEFWVFALANLIVLGFGSVLTVLSYVAYRSRPAASSFRTAALGFGAITLGGVVEPAYQLGIRGDYHLSGRELLAMQAIEGLLIALGLGLLFYSIRGYRGRSRSAGPTAGVETNEFYNE